MYDIIHQASVGANIYEGGAKRMKRDSRVFLLTFHIFDLKE